MSEMEIRINTRTLERTVYILIILALAVVLVFRWNAVAPLQADVDVTELESQIETLTASNEELQATIDDLEREAELVAEAEAERESATGSETPAPEPEPEPEAEETLSGELLFDWDIDMDGDQLEAVQFSVDNGLDRSQEIEYKLYWAGFYEDTVFVSDDIVVRSGDSETIVVLRSTDSFTRNPPSGTDELTLDLRDSDGDLLERLEQNVR